MSSVYNKIKALMERGQPVPYELRLAFLNQPTKKPTIESQCTAMQAPNNDRHLFHGDNLQTLLHLHTPQWQDWLRKMGGLKLIYIDPPYNVGSDFSTKKGEFAFTDKWKSEGAYLQFLQERIELMYDLLDVDGSFYLHCDHRMVAPIRLMLDGIFGRANFRNEIIWYFTNGGGRALNYFNRKHNTIFLYSKTSRPIYNGKQAGVPRNKDGSTFSGYFRTDEQGRRFQEVRSNNKVYKYYLDEKKNADDVWTIPIISQRDKTERIDYPTQKPLKLIERIILASSNPGDLIADFFCGSGTTLIGAEQLGRKWLGSDLGDVAIQRCRQRLATRNQIHTFGQWKIH